MADTDKHTSAYKIFHYYIRAQVPRAFVNPGLQELMGTIAYDTNEKARMAAQEGVAGEFTVAQLVEMSSKGATITLLDPEQSTDIYQWILDVLEKKASQTQFSLHNKPIDLESLEKLESFAEKVFRVGRNYRKDDLHKSYTTQKVNDLFKHRTVRHKPKEENPGPNRHIPEHEPVTPIIKRSAIERQLPIRENNEDGEV